MEKMNNELATHISECCIANTYMNYPQVMPRDVDLKNQLLDYVKIKGLVDLGALVTPEQLAVFGSAHKGSSSSSRPHSEQRVEAVPLGFRRCVHEDSYAKNDVTLIRWRTSSSSQPIQPAVVRLSNAPPASACDIVEALPMSASASGPRIAWSYLQVEQIPLWS
ncbi:hypothetical protein SLEP1_g33113 [Rubroshorea leprosula]|uniref:Uncharacterized protein n=1 Tax=Rubroshorea leprosula TaxID=152421 RepID=A0AAV5KFL5_9ROSI|nr:hypothetical protein SLEP1_g33113 [Rubroshorea leprosula]